MAKFATKFESKRQDWETPDEIFLPLDAEFQFVIDVCATEQNKKYSLRYTEVVFLLFCVMPPLAANAKYSHQSLVLSPFPCPK